VSEERLQKFLAAAGVASRRKAEALITSGRVAVNQRVVTELGSKVDPGRDLVTVDGKLVSRAEERSYFLLYKPPGCVTTASDPEGRPTALDYLRGVRARVFSVGRLDHDAEGAVLFTDDGELANRLAHPRYGHARVYLVKVKGEPPAEALERMRAGVRLEDGPARAIEVALHERAERNVWIRLVVGEGRFHLVKRLCEAVGLQVARLFRPEFGGVAVDGLRPGQFRPLAPGEVLALKQRVGLAAGTPAPAPAPSALPKAARRHGHGPPSAGPAEDAPSALPKAGRRPGRGSPSARPGEDAPSVLPKGGRRPGRGSPSAGAGAGEDAPSALPRAARRYGRGSPSAGPAEDAPTALPRAARRYGRGFPSPGPAEKRRAGAPAPRAGPRPAAPRGGRGGGRRP
jgi:23S rRNA pseudouridine2605 synthase